MTAALGKHAQHRMWGCRRQSDKPLEAGFQVFASLERAGKFGSRPSASGSPSIGLGRGVQDFPVNVVSERFR